MNTSTLNSATTHAAGDPPTVEIGDPRWEIRVGLAGGIGLLLGSLLWAGVARLDAAVMAPGVIEVAGDRRLIQSPTEGAVAAVRVHEGQHVTAGQILIELQSSASNARERALAVRVISTEAEVARLTAEQEGANHVEEPVRFASLSGDDLLEAERAMALARAELTADRDVDRGQGQILRQRQQQIGQQIRGYSEQNEANARQRAISGQELTGLQELLARGFASRNRVLEMQRSAAALEGESGAQDAEIAQLKSATGEVQLQLSQYRQQAAEKRSEEIRTAQSDLQELLPEWHAARDALAQSLITAPVSGTVMGLELHGSGSVAAIGQTLLSLVPDDQSVKVEARVSINDANDLRVGQPVTVRITGLEGHGNPVVRGRIAWVSPDSFTDEHAGISFFKAGITILPVDLSELARGSDLLSPLRAGTPVTVEVPLRKRTALSYLIEPLAQAWHTSLSER